MINFKDLVYKYLYRDAYIPRTHHPSSCLVNINGKARGRCLREQFYKWTGAKQSNPINEQTYFKFFMGNCAHEGLQKLFEDLDIAKTIEEHIRQKIKGLKHMIGYKKDATIFISKETQEMLKLSFGINVNDEDVGKEVILEIKTSWGRGIDSVLKDGAKDNGVLQSICYLHLSQLDTVYLVYFDVSGIIEQFVYYKRPDGVSYDYRNKKNLDINISDILRGFKAVETAVESGVVPERSFFCFKKSGELKDMRQKDGMKYMSDFQCRFCNYKDKCWEDVKDNEIPEELEGKPVKKVKKKTKGK
jgi:CRISPR/Cas system-associated exonuclease Cas4 (RecB family)